MGIVLQKVIGDRRRNVLRLFLGCTPALGGVMTLYAEIILPVYGGASPLGRILFRCVGHTALKNLVLQINVRLALEIGEKDVEHEGEKDEVPAELDRTALHLTCIFPIILFTFVGRYLQGADQNILVCLLSEIALVALEFYESFELIRGRTTFEVMVGKVWFPVRDFFCPARKGELPSWFLRSFVKKKFPESQNEKESEKETRNLALHKKDLRRKKQKMEVLLGNLVTVMGVCEGASCIISTVVWFIAKANMTKIPFGEKVEPVPLLTIAANGLIMFVFEVFVSDYLVAAYSKWNADQWGGGEDREGGGDVDGCVVVDGGINEDSVNKNGLNTDDSVNNGLNTAVPSEEPARTSARASGPSRTSAHSSDASSAKAHSSAKDAAKDGRKSFPRSISNLFLRTSTVTSLSDQDSPDEKYLEIKVDVVKTWRERARWSYWVLGFAVVSWSCFWISLLCWRFCIRNLGDSAVFTLCVAEN